MTITTLAELSANLNDGKTSSVEITKDYLTRIENSTHNAFISVNAELAISQAKKADQQRANGEASPLLGVPVAQKDIFCIDGTQTTCGSKILEGFIAVSYTHLTLPTKA